MKLTIAQQKVVDRAKELEVKHGQGNVFIRWIGNSARFIVHKKNDETVVALFSSDDKIGKRVLDSLDNKGLLTFCDCQHNKEINPNDWRNKPDDWCFVGARIKTEVL